MNHHLLKPAHNPAGTIKVGHLYRLYPYPDNGTFSYQIAIKSDRPMKVTGSGWDLVGRSISFSEADRSFLIFLAVTEADPLEYYVIVRYNDDYLVVPKTHLMDIEQ